MIVTAFNPSTDNLEKSFTSRAYPAGTEELRLRNTNNFNEDDYILIGEMGFEQSEIVQVTGVDADHKQIDISATKFPHSPNSPVYVLKYNEIKFYRSTTTIDDTYTELASIPIDVDNSDKRTRYDDPNGLPSYFYKISFFNSHTNVESEQSDPIPGGGYERKQVGTIVNDFLTEIGDLEQEYMTVPQIISLMNDVNDDLIGHSRRPYRFLKTSVLVDVVADENRIALPDDLVKFNRARYTREDIVDIKKKTLPMISIDEMEYKDYHVNVEPSPTPLGIIEAAIDDETNELVLRPTPRTTQEEALRIHYWGEFKEIKSLADKIQTPNGRIYKMFLLARYYRIRAKKETSFLVLSDRYNNDYNTEIVKLQRDYKVDVGTPPSQKRDTRTARGVRR